SPSNPSLGVGFPAIFLIGRDAKVSRGGRAPRHSEEARATNIVVFLPQTQDSVRAGVGPPVYGTWRRHRRPALADEAHA
ncbi:hypothetical protein, partial [Raoultibacter timonensis]|uniref:hypothetical protein n=1 Tax=Raoultibacter timonensis TaxID=1907662 RepID=UPI0026DCC858